MEKQGGGTNQKIMNFHFCFFFRGSLFLSFTDFANVDFRFSIRHLLVAPLSFIRRLFVAYLSLIRRLFVAHSSLLRPLFVATLSLISSRRYQLIFERL